jgi:hypothetical protein
MHDGPPAEREIDADVLLAGCCVHACVPPIKLTWSSGYLLVQVAASCRSFLGPCYLLLVLQKVEPKLMHA